MQEWQYPGGIALEKLFAPTIPEWSVVLGLATSTKPAYSGASQYEGSAGPVFDIRYRDRAFLSAGEGLGANLIVRSHFRLSLALGIDLGRRMSWHYATLHGLGDIPRAPFIKLGTTYVLSKRLPILFRADIRKLLGGAAGWVGDLEVYTPLPGSSRKFIMFAGPSVTLADRKHLQTLYGISPYQALQSGDPVFLPHGGLEAAGLGFSATRFFKTHWLGNMNISVSELMGSAGRSPLTERRTQATLTLSTAYRW